MWEGPAYWGICHTWAGRWSWVVEPWKAKSAAFLYSLGFSSCLDILTFDTGRTEANSLHTSFLAGGNWNMKSEKHVLYRKTLWLLDRKYNLECATGHVWKSELAFLLPRGFWRPNSRLSNSDYWVQPRCVTVSKTLFKASILTLFQVPHNSVKLFHINAQV